MSDRTSILVSQGLYSGFSFLLLAIAGKTLETDDFAALGIIVTLINVAQVVPTSFLYLPLLSRLDVVENHRHRHTLFGLILSFGNALLVASLGYLLSTDFLLSFYGGIYSFSLTLYDYHRRENYTDSNFTSALALESGRYIIFLLTLALIGLTSNAILIAGFLSNSLAFFRLRPAVSFHSIPRDVFAHAKALWDFSSWLFLSGSLQALARQGYFFVAATMLSKHTLAVLVALQTIFGVTTVFFLAVENYYSPRIALIYRENNYISYTAYYDNTRRSAHIYGLLIMATLILSSPYILDAWFRIRGDDIVFVSLAFFSAIPFLLELRFATMKLRIENKSKDLAYVSFIGLFVTAVVTYPLYLALSLTGIALAATLSTIIMAYLADARATFRQPAGHAPN